MLVRIGLGVLVLAAVLVIAIVTRPDTFHIERSVTIAAPAEVIFAQLDDFHRWERWNPFEKLDPNVRRSYVGAPSGVGAVYHYVGNGKVGEGRMTMTEVTPGERVAIKAEFIKPFAAINQTEFTLEPVAGGVSVTWAMSGRQPFMGKAISLVMNMDKVVGKEFETGLAELKRVSEAEATRHTALGDGLAGASTLH